MPDVQEVFRMATQKVRPDPDFLERQHRNQRRRMRNRKYGAIGLVAVLGVVATILIVANRPIGDTTAPAGDPSTFIPPPAGRPTELALQVVENFLDAYASFDAEGAMRYLADDADLTGLMLEPVFVGEETLRLDLAMLKATRFAQTLRGCQGETLSASITKVDCVFDFHIFGSDEIGRGPFTDGTYSFGVQTVSSKIGLIAWASVDWDYQDDLSPQMWEPFAEWVSTNYPDDAAVMYTDDTHTLTRLSERSVRLWGRHVAGYVEAVQQGTA
jgi:hypothetical protein